MGIIFLPKKIKNRVSSRLLTKIRVSQVFWEPIKNRVSPRSALFKAVYLEALLYHQVWDLIGNPSSAVFPPERLDIFTQTNYVMSMT